MSERRRLHSRRRRLERQIHTTGFWEGDPDYVTGVTKEHARVMRALVKLGWRPYPPMGKGR